MQVIWAAAPLNRTAARHGRLPRCARLARAPALWRSALALCWRSAPTLALSRSPFGALPLWRSALALCLFLALCFRRSASLALCLSALLALWHSWRSAWPALALWWRSACSLALYFGALPLWRSAGALALSRSGALALSRSAWRSGALPGALALWRSGALALWRSALALWLFLHIP